MSEALLSVGIDIGTTTTQLIFSRLTVRNESNACSVPNFSIAEKEILYRSPIHFTPLLSDTVIDVDGIRDIVTQEYNAAGIRQEDIQTGAVIITGETARKENAAQVLSALSGYAGEFVVATAGPALESVLAGKGAGAQTCSEARQCAVLNLDIGGGTTNLALFDRGALVDTGCLNVGGRLMKFTPTGVLTYLSPVLQPYFSFPLGQSITPEQLEPVVQLLVSVLQWAVQGVSAEGFRPTDFVTDKLISLSAPPLLSFSGGVADLLRSRPADPFAYGDLGVLLGQAIARSPLFSDNVIPASETIRATVIGAGIHSTRLSGSTIFHRDITFPLKNLPVASLQEEEEMLESAALAARIRERRAVFGQENEPVVLSLRGKENLRFSELCKLADGIAESTTGEDTSPLIVAVQHDFGKSLGQALGLLLPKTPLLCLDGLELSEGSYLDIGTPIASGQVLPVVIKTLVL